MHALMSALEPYGRSSGGSASVDHVDHVWRRMSMSRSVASRSHGQITGWYIWMEIDFRRRHDPLRVVRAARHCAADARAPAGACLGSAATSETTACRSRRRPRMREHALDARYADAVEIVRCAPSAPPRRAAQLVGGMIGMSAWVRIGSSPVSEPL